MQSINDGNGIFAPLNGNDPANRQLISATVSGITWLPNQELWIRWNGVSHPFDWSHALALDDLTFTALPNLQISTGAAGQLRISWPAGFTNFTLRSAVTFPPTTWENWSNNLTTSGSAITLDIPPTDPHRYFQLQLQ